MFPSLSFCSWVPSLLLTFSIRKMTCPMRSSSTDHKSENLPWSPQSQMVFLCFKHYVYISLYSFTHFHLEVWLLSCHIWTTLSCLQKLECHSGCLKSLTFFLLNSIWIKAKLHTEISWEIRDSLRTKLYNKVEKLKKPISCVYNGHHLLLTQPNTIQTL